MYTPRFALAVALIATPAAGNAPLLCGGDHHLVVILKPSYDADGSLMKDGLAELKTLCKKGPGETFYELRFPGRPAFRTAEDARIFVEHIADNGKMLDHGKPPGR